MKMLGTLAMILVVVGALNWGMVGLLNLNLVTALFGEGSTLTMVVYSLVGLSGLYVAATVLPKQMQ
ncbi:DUF378 domain-containing protein [Candidatus Daviesbacteria bacterium RIFCSPHIGHO2_01_FULL_36_37]|nr:MAG: hypothetical protein US28_C0009G0008 [Candidatus Daviesbacteria bacterium GW2011_GWA1_36_8]OGE16895.1 MAG: DUF378 domain-containing protein [Candidatus Daviesbacteria bacterium RIFCSPHIGHO2_01_FULL_36_37]OGE31270.1 MAG: DUF378 domain-containing protein [Candidatus Daviesbacteria bacterium RIFCSPHIGHO2_02_FULL_37_9]OGE36036.1 MAG: DUF378 domain-containing protein [Candidatus Daviesbacteria bacterium RIFCSPHIGHO2_12_FULL_37_16]